jgi:hypothetical protein
MRVAALISESAEREEAREKVQGAFELERALMAGRALDTGRAMGIAAWLEDGARAILRDAALGELGDEIGTTADEALIAAGLDAGEGSAEQMGGTSEWDAIAEPASDEAEEMQIIVSHVREGDEQETQQFDAVLPDGDQIVIRAGGEITVVEEDGDERWDQSEEHLPATDAERGERKDLVRREPSEASTRAELDEEEIPVTQSSDRDWLAEVSRERREDTLEWPARRAMRDSDERVDSPRVRHLFPVPEADWEVGELKYDRDSARVG